MYYRKQIGVTNGQTSPTSPHGPFDGSSPHRPPWSACIVTAVRGRALAHAAYRPGVLETVGGRFRAWSPFSLREPRFERTPLPDDRSGARSGSPTGPGLHRRRFRAELH